jgi:hypothetical protein
MRRFLRGLGKFIWRFMVIFSFIVNVVLVVVLIGLLLFIFDIKNNIAQPLVTGLHSSFIGLDQATIDWTIPVRADVPVNLEIPLQQNTVVTLTEDVPLQVVAQIYASGLTVTNATVYLTLPKDLDLPVALNLPVIVEDTLPVSLDVRAVIPLQNTQLHDVAENLRLLFEPLAVGLTNLPGSFNEVGPFLGDVFAGRANLLEANVYTANPWPGFSTTAGLNYPEELLTAPIPQENVPIQTGIVPKGGIPGLDEQIRPEVYAQGGPDAVNNAFTAQTADTIPPQYYNGGYADYREAVLGGGGTVPNDGTTDTNTTLPDQTSATEEVDQGILPTPTP